MKEHTLKKRKKIKCPSTNTIYLGNRSEELKYFAYREKINKVWEILLKSSGMDHN